MNYSEKIEQTITRQGFGQVHVDLDALLAIVKTKDDGLELLPEEKHSLDQLYNILVNYTKNHQITPEDFNIIQTKVLTLLDQSYENKGWKALYYFIMLLGVAGFAISGLPGVKNIVSQYLIGASNAWSKTVISSAIMGGSAVQVALYADTVNSIGPANHRGLVLGGPHLTIASKTLKKQPIVLTRAGNTFRTQWPVRNACQFALVLLTSLSNSILTLGSQITVPSIAMAMLAFPGSVVVFTLSTRYFIETAGPNMLRTFGELSDFFAELKRNSNSKFYKLFLSLAHGVGFCALSILTIVIAVISQLITMGFVGALGELILKLTAAFLGENIKDSIPAMLISYGLGSGSALPITLLFTSGILAIAVKMLHGTASIFCKKNTNSTEEIKQSCLQLRTEQLHYSVCILGILSASLYAGLNSPGTAISAIDTFLDYFSIILSDEFSLSLQAILTSGATLTNGRFAINIYELILEKAKQHNLYSAMSVMSEEEAPLKEAMQQEQSNQAIINGRHFIETPAFSAGVGAMTGGIISAVDATYYLCNLSENNNGILVEILQLVLKDLSTTIPAFAVYGFIFGFLIALVGYILVGTVLFIQPRVCGLLDSKRHSTS